MRKKAVVFSDAHLDAMTCGQSRFADVSAACEYIVDYAVAQEANKLIFCGDLADDDSPRVHACVAELARWINKARGATEFVIVAGNHDVVEDGDGSTIYDAILELEGGHVETCVEPSTFELWSGTQAIALPFAARGRNYDPAKFIENYPMPSPPAVVFGHLNLKGATQHGSESKEFLRGRDVFWPIEELRKRFPGIVIVAGHYHEGRELDGVHIVGSPAVFTFGDEERHKPCFLVLTEDVVTRRVRVERHILPPSVARRLKTVRTREELADVCATPAGAFARIIAGSEVATEPGLDLNAVLQGFTIHADTSSSAPPSAEAPTPEDFEGESLRLAAEWDVQNDRLKANIETMVSEVLEATRPA